MSCYPFIFSDLVDELIAHCIGYRVGLLVAFSDTTEAFYHATFINTMTTGSSRKKLCGLLTSNEAEVLRPLYMLRNKFTSLEAVASQQPGWCRCRDLGGARDSHHSLTLRRLGGKGLVDIRPLAPNQPGEKSLFVYRISRQGEMLWEEYTSYLSLFEQSPALPVAA